MDSISDVSKISERMRGLRLLLDISEKDMAEATGVDIHSYIEMENGAADFSVTFLQKAADKLGIDLVELLTGKSATLSLYTLVKRGEGLPVKRRSGFEYQHLAHLFKNNIADPFLVTAKYDAQAEKDPIHFNTHEGQEFDYVLSGKLKMNIDGHEFFVEAGDSVYYDSSKKHGMVAADGTDCVFLAVVIKK